MAQIKIDDIQQNQEPSEEDARRIAGGIIIVGGRPTYSSQYYTQSTLGSIYSNPALSRGIIIVGG